MNITLEKKDALNAVVKITVENSDYLQKVEEALKKQRRNAQIRGFRPGMAPMGMIKKLYGKAILFEELNHIVSHRLMDYIRDEKLDILGDPLPHEADLGDMNEGDSFTFSFDLGMAPEFEPSFSKKNKIPYYIITPDDKMREGFIENHRRRHGEFMVNDTVREESMVKGTVSALNENMEPDINVPDTEDASLLISMLKDEAGKDLFIGKSAGDEVIFDIRTLLKSDIEIASFLKIKKEEVASVHGNYLFRIESVSSFEPAPMDASFFSKVYGGDGEMTEAQFIEKVNEEISNNLTRESDYRFRIDAIDYAVEKTGFDLPEEFLKRWLLSVNKEITPEQLDKEFGSFIKDMKWQLIRNKIARANELKVTEEELMSEAMAVTRNQFNQYGLYYATDDQIAGYARELLKKEEDARRLADRILDTKVTDFIRSNVKPDEKKVTTEQFNKLFEKA